MRKLKKEKKEKKQSPKEKIRAQSQEAPLPSHPPKAKEEEKWRPQIEHMGTTYLEEG
jgi:hypothetical protein